MSSRKQTRSDNQQAEEHLQAASDIIHALDSLDDSVVIFDKDWRYQFINHKGWKVLARPKSEVLGKNVWELLPHIVGSEYYKAAHRAMEQQKKIEIQEYYPHRRAWFRTTFYPSRNSLVAQIRDVTELVEAQRINEQLTGTLEQAMEVYWREENREKRERARSDKS